MTNYEAAVKMIDRENSRWNQLILIYFVSIFIVIGIGIICELRPYYDLDLPGWLPFLLCFIFSIFYIVVATNLRASKYAWRETILHLEREGLNDETGVFSLQKEYLDRFNHINDLLENICFWKKETLTSVTRMIVLLGVIYCILFLLAFIAIFFEW